MIGYFKVKEQLCVCFFYRLNESQEIVVCVFMLCVVYMSTHDFIICLRSKIYTCSAESLFLFT